MLKLAGGAALVRTFKEGGHHTAQQEKEVGTHHEYSFTYIDTCLYLIVFNAIMYMYTRAKETV